jgi:hypothetical protein
MKKFYSFVFALVLSAGAINAQCVIDSAAQTTTGVNPTAHDLPCIQKTVAYNQTIQGKIQESGDTVFNLPLVGAVTGHFKVDSVILDSITGAPAGIIPTWNPAVIYGGGNGCVNLAGTTTADTGLYYLTVWGTAYLRGSGSAGGQSVDTPFTRKGNLNRYSPFGNYYLVVIDQGAQCVHPTFAGINDFNSDLNSAFSVYPNPNNGVFEVKLNAGNRVNGDINVVDMTGRIVYSQKLDVMGLYNTNIDLTTFSKGLYTVQLRTAEGFASKRVSVE